MKYTLLWSACCAVVLACPPASRADTGQAAFPAATLAAIEAHFRESGMPGMCVVTFDVDGITGAVALGFSDLASRRPYGLDTIQSVGSVSKTTIGYSLALLSTQGLLDLDATIDPVLGAPVRNPKHPTAALSARQLATHTSSVIDRASAYRRAYQRGSAPNTSMTDFVADYFLPGGKLYSAANFGADAPGQRFRYTNMGAALAAVLVERRSGQVFSEFTQAQIFAPLGMADTSWDQQPGPRTAIPHKASGKAWPVYSLITYADGALRSSCRDLVRYGTALLRAASNQPSALDARAVRLMLAGQFDPSRTPPGMDPGETNQGLFWQHRRSGGIGHSGSDPGISAFILLQPDSQRGQLLLTNCGLDESPRFEAGFRRIWALLREADAPPTG